MTGIPCAWLSHGYPVIVITIYNIVGTNMSILRNK